MSKQLIATNTSERSAIQASYNAAKTAVQAVVTGYAAMGITALVAGDFSRLFNDTEGLVFDKITGGTLTIGGLPVDRVQGLKLLTKPAGYDAFMAAVAALRQNALAGFPQQGNNARVSFTLENITALFTLNSSLVVNFSTLAQAQYDDAGKYYVETDKAKAAFAFIQAVVAAYYANGLDTWFFARGREHEIPMLIASGIYSLNDAGQTFEVNAMELQNRYDRER